MGWKFLEDIGEKVAEAAERDDAGMAKALQKRVNELDLDIDDLEIEFSKGVATVSGLAADDATIEKAILAIGNTAGVAEVEADGFTSGLTDAEKAEYMKKREEVLAAAKKAAEDRKSAEAAAKARSAMRAQRRRVQEKTSRSMSKFYTVEKGDSLSKIAKEFYGDASKYPVIFEANTPMLKNPDLIYPGQVLRIPAQ